MTATSLEPERPAVPTSDAKLIRRCLRGQKSAFQALYRRYQRPVRGTLFQLCGEAELDDLVQEVFLRAWKGLPKFRQSAQFSTWLYRITWNVATDRRRR
ncbi:MAG: sigma-70 family RNA polymerase sigma factor, partial [Cyanobacteria bacterium P01_H01_bin.152]